jgi:hypothetical protein
LEAEGCNDAAARNFMKGRMMKQNSRRAALALSFAALAGFVTTGCDVQVGEVQVGDLLGDIELQLNSSVDQIQTRDPRAIALPPPIVDRGDTVIIEEEVEIIISVQEQLVIEDLPDITLVGFENLTGFDVYLTYVADGVVQEVFVFAGETLLLEYPCLDAVQLLTEEDYDEFGEFVQSFDLEADYFNPEDFFCGEALILTLDPFEVIASIEIIDLAP